MEFRVLGLLEVADDGRRVDVGAGKESALLALLLLNANRPLSTDRLVDELWEEQRRPDNAAKTVQIYVSRLRRHLGRDRIVTTPAGYVLRAAVGELDSARFEELAVEGQGRLEAGDPARAEAALSEALALWRGEVLADFRFEEFAQAEIARLEEQRGAAISNSVDARLSLGQAEELIGVLEGQIRVQPLLERPRAQLMLALYRAGRIAAALEAYQSLRAVLIEELGVEPSRSVRNLHQQILNQDPALDLAPHPNAPAVLPEPPAPGPGPGNAGAAHDARKTVTVLFVRVAISPEQGEPLDPETLRRLEGRAYTQIGAAVERHGGSVENVAAGSLTAILGLPSVHEDDALRAVRAAVDARRALASLADELSDAGAVRLEFEMGLSTGEVITGGDTSPAHGRATGEPLRHAALLASRGKLVIDQATHRLVRDAIVAEPLDGAWEVADVLDDWPRDRPRRLASPMVGRERERRRLLDAFDQAVADCSTQLFTVLGLAGVGKSRLVEEFLRELDDRALVARGRCLPYGEGITYWPLAEVVKEAVGLEDGESAVDALARLTQVLEEREGAELAARRVAETIGLVEAAGGVDEGFAAVEALFGGLARVRPMVVVFDNVHWGEATFLDLVEHLAGRMRDAPILLVCLARPDLLDLRPGWGGGMPNATTTLLEPLSGGESALLIRNLVGHGRLEEEDEHRIAAAAGGNPLFVEEVLSMLIDDGVLFEENGRWAVSRDISTVRVPPTIQALLAARLDQLDENERAVIERAAIVGEVFYEDAVADLTRPFALAAVPDALASLTRKDLIRSERPNLGYQTYRFRHLLIRDAAYESIPKEARAELHERFGRWLDRTAAGRTIEHEEVVGYHLEQAYRYTTELGPPDETAQLLAREAALRLGSAGRRAFLRSDGHAGVNLISRAAALLPPEDRLRVDLVPNVRVVQGLVGEVAWADRVLTEAVEAAATTGDRSLAAHALVQRGLLRLFTEPGVTSVELLDVADRSIAVFEELGDELGLARAWRLKAQALYLARLAGPCADASEEALVHARIASDRFEEQEIVEWLAIALVLGPAPASDAAERCRRLMGEVSELPRLQAELLAALALLEAMAGHLGEAAELIRRFHETASRLNSWIWVGSVWHAFILLWQDDPIAAEHELLPVYDALKQMGEKSHFSTILHGLSRALYAQGRYAEAEQLTYECEEVSRPNDVHSQINWRSIRAKTLARRAEHQPALALAREAVAFAEKSDFLLAHGEALVDLADVLERNGQRKQAIEALEQAVAVHQQKGNVLARERLSVRLTSLAG